MTQTKGKFDIYDSLTESELETVTTIFLDALSRQTNIQPEVFGIETNIIVDTISELTDHFYGDNPSSVDDTNSYKSIPSRY